MWQIENVGEKERKVSITFVMKNGTGNKKQDGAGGMKTETFDGDDSVRATIMQTITDMPCNYSISVNKSGEDLKTAKVAKIDPNGSGSALWNENGIPTEKSEDKSLKDGKDVCIAVAGQKLLNPGVCDEIEFALVWDMPKVKFPRGSKFYSKYYTKYFGSDGNAGPKIIEYAFKNFCKWEQLIVDEWQRDVLEDE